MGRSKAYRLAWGCSLMMMLLLCWACTRKTIIAEPTPPRPEERYADLLAKAEKHYQAGQLDQALSLYQDHLALHPDIPSAPMILLKIGTIQSSKGQHEAARDTYRQMIAAYPNSRLVPEARLNILSDYYQEGRFPEVVEYHQELNDFSIPTEILMRKYGLVGDSYLAMAEYALAFEAFLRVYQRANDMAKKPVMKKLEAIFPRLSAKELSQLAAKMEDSELKRSLLFHLGGVRAVESKKPEVVRDEPGLEQKAPEPAKTMESVSGAGYAEPSVGCLLPLSGKYETFGAKALKGIQLALEKYSRTEKAPPVRIIIRDTEGDAGKTAQGVQELAQDEHTAAIIGPLVTAEDAATAAQESKIPIITLTQKQDMANMGGYVFRNYLTPEMQVRALIAYTMNELGLRRFAILYPDEKYGSTFMNLFWDEVSANKGEVVGIESYGVNATDFSAAIKKLTGQRRSATAAAQGKLDFEAIFIPDGAEKAGMILPQLTYFDVVDVYRLGTNLWHNEKLLQSTGQYMQEVVIPEIFFAESRNEQVKEFVRLFEETYSEKPGFLEAVAYDTAMILFQTVNRAGVDSREAVKNELLKTKDFHGVTGLTSFDQNGNARKQLYLLKVEGDHFVELGQGQSLKPETGE